MRSSAWLKGLIAVAVATNVLADDSHIVLPPANGDSNLPEKMLVFIPGGKVPNANYIVTAKAIQQATSQLRLWVVIPAVFQRLCIITCSTKALCSPLHSKVEEALDQAKAKGWKRGDDSKDLFLAGHSLGGVCANTLFQAYTSPSANPAAALIVMGSYVDESGSFDLTNYPKPLLTLNAELDGGLARPGKTAIWWRQFEGLSKSKGEAFALTQKPVIILPRQNHSNFCPGFEVPGDLPGEISETDGLAIIGSAVAAFLHGLVGASRGSALEAIGKHVKWTRELLTPYLTAQDLERTPSDQDISSEGASPFCAKAQHIVAGLSPADDARVSVKDGFHVASTQLEHCHPNWTHAEGRTLQVLTCSHTDFYTDIDNTGSFSAASEIACKMLSSDRLAQQLNTTAANPKVSCSAGNMYAVQVAEQLAAKSTLERYKQAGRGWCFLEDHETLADIGPVWVFKDSLTLSENATCMSVSSAMLKTAVDGHIFPGSHYCKFLSPARVLDWMMTDSLKRPKGVVEAAPGPAEMFVV